MTSMLASEREGATMRLIVALVILSISGIAVAGLCSDAQVPTVPPHSHGTHTDTLLMHTHSSRVDTLIIEHEHPMPLDRCIVYDFQGKCLNIEGEVVR